MSSTPAKQTSTTPSPQITPLHDPAHQAVIVNQQAPLGTANRSCRCSRSTGRNADGRITANPVIPGRLTDPSIAGASMGQKALLAKRFAKAKCARSLATVRQADDCCHSKPSLISPTDQLQSPCTAKLSGAKQKHFQKSVLVVRPFALPTNNTGGNLPTSQRPSAASRCQKATTRRTPACNATFRFYDDAPTERDCVRCRVDWPRADVGR